MSGGVGGLTGAIPSARPDQGRRVGFNRPIAELIKTICVQTVTVDLASVCRLEIALDLEIQAALAIAAFSWRATWDWR